MRNSKSIQEGKPEKILGLYSQGFSFMQIHKMTGFSKGTLSYHLSKGQKEKTKQRDKKNKPICRDRKQEWFFELKSKTPCNHCGFIVDPSALDYHHLDRSTKKSAVGRMVGGNWSIESVQEEIDKCIPLCANCHRVEESNLNEDFASKKRQSL